MEVFIANSDLPKHIREDVPVCIFGRPITLADCAQAELFARHLNTAVSRLRCDCVHSTHERDTNFNDIVYCDTCGQNLGWYCPVRPTHYCEIGEYGACVFCETEGYRT